MKSGQELYKERMERITKAIALEKPDRTPVVLMIDGFCAYHVGMKLSEFCSSLQASNAAMLKSMLMLGDVDGSNAACKNVFIWPLSNLTLAKLPGRDLPENALWQLDEKERMTQADYDIIVNKGWSWFLKDFVTNRLGVNLEELSQKMTGIAQLEQNFRDAGFVVFASNKATVVAEFLFGGRSMAKFLTDLYKVPDKVEAAMDVIHEETMNTLRQQIRAKKPPVVFVTCSRGASEFYSPKLWERFIWKYYKATTDVIIEEGSVASFHIDSNWGRDLEYFRAFPKGRCVYETDGVTDIYKIKEVLGDRMCIKGDVPASMLALGTPDEVYNYSSNLIRDMGPGFILSSGCTIPANAPLANVEAMIAAATGK